MGTGKWQSVPTAGCRWMLDERGSFFLPFARYAFDVAGSDARRHISELQLNPMMHMRFGSGHFLTLWTEPLRYNFRSGKWLIPADVTVGKIVNDAIVVSLQLSAPIHYEPGYKLYGRRAEARIGFFF